MATDREVELLQTAYKAGIVSPVELANFMAQVSHESGGLAHLEEGFRYTKGSSYIADKVPSALREGPEALEAARVEALNAKPEKLAELMYGGRMGNDQPGDGYNYRGRGFIQLTGKNQYAEAGDALQIDLVKNPDLAAKPENASKIATWYWNQNVHDVAPETVLGAGRVINLGNVDTTRLPNNLQDREARFHEWEKALTPEVMAQLANGEPPGLPIASEAKHSEKHTDQGKGIGANTLRQGMRSDEISRAQTELHDLGYLQAEPNGRFGPQTKSATEAFQLSQGLDVDGKIGPITQRHLDAAVRDKQIEGMTASLPLPLRDFSDPSHPQNALYNTLKEGFPPGVSAQVLSQCTAACYMAGIRQPDDLGHVTGMNGSILFESNSLFGNNAMIDMSQPTPSVQQTMQNVQQFDQQRASRSEQFQTQINAQAPQVPGY